MTELLIYSILSATFSWDSISKYSLSGNSIVNSIQSSINTSTQPSVNFPSKRYKFKIKFNFLIVIAASIKIKL